MSGPITREPAAMDCTALNLYIDGELDTRASLDFEAHVESCSDCGGDLAAYRDLRRRLQTDLTHHGATEVFRRKIAALPAAPVETNLRPAAPSPRLRNTWLHWSSLAAAAAMIAVISSTSTLYLSRPGPEASWVDGVVAAHERAMLSGHEIDVASSSRHVVKPWFSGKTAFAPLVVDLDDVGFPLIGGRLDVPLREPVPALIYRAGPHVVSVYMQPAEGDAPPHLAKVDGFSVLTWRQNGFAFFAVSDADGAEVEKFQAAFAAKAATMH